MILTYFLLFLNLIFYICNFTFNQYICLYNYFLKQVKITKIYYLKAHVFCPKNGK